MEVEVVAGAHNLQVAEPSQVSIFSTDLTVHEGYNSFLLLNDVSILRLPTPLTFNGWWTHMEINAQISYLLSTLVCRYFLLSSHKMNKF